MKLISFSMTKEAFLNGSKTVTRRIGWKSVKPGDFLMGVEKAQGLKKGEKVKKLGPLEVVNVRQEPLDRIEGEGFLGTSMEGLPELSPTEFCHRFARAMKCRTDAKVTRIEFERVYEVPCPECAELFFLRPSKVPPEPWVAICRDCSPNSKGSRPVTKLLGLRGRS